MTTLQMILMCAIGGLAVAGLMLVIAHIWYDLIERGWDKDE